MDKAHLLIRTDHHRGCYLIEAVMGADRITLATGGGAGRLAPG